MSVTVDLAYDATHAFARSQPAEADRIIEGFSPRAAKIRGLGDVEMVARFGHEARLVEAAQRVWFSVLASKHKIPNFLINGIAQESRGPAPAGGRGKSVPKAHQKTACTLSALRSEYNDAQVDRTA